MQKLLAADWSFLKKLDLRTQSNNLSPQQADRSICNLVFQIHLGQLDFLPHWPQLAH